jgi:hypothetical protein
MSLSQSLDKSVVPNKVVLIDPELVGLTLTDATLVDPTISGTITGPFGVTGAVSITGDLGVTGTTSFSGPLGVTGAVSITGPLGVTGAVSVSGGAVTAPGFSFPTPGLAQSVSPSSSYLAKDPAGTPIQFILGTDYTWGQVGGVGNYGWVGSAGLALGQTIITGTSITASSLVFAQTQADNGLSRGVLTVSNVVDGVVTLQSRNPANLLESNDNASFEWMIWNPTVPV